MKKKIRLDDQKIINQLSLYVDDFDALKKLESNNKMYSIIIIAIVVSSLIIGYFFNYYGDNIGNYIMIPIIIIAITFNLKFHTQRCIIDTIVKSFKKFVLLQLLEKKEVIQFNEPISHEGFTLFNEVINEIHLFDSSICIIEHIGYTKDKKIESIIIKQIDAEKLSKIINLNALTNFSYAPI